jgi:hypothetical protein
MPSWLVFAPRLSLPTRANSHTGKTGPLEFVGHKKCKKMSLTNVISCMKHKAVITLLLLWSSGAGLAAGDGREKKTGSQERQAIERTLQLLEESSRQWLSR